MREWGKYTGVAFEMIATVVLFVFVGRWIDRQWPMSFPVGTFFWRIVGRGGKFVCNFEKILA